MAMLEHECRECKYVWSNNQPEFGCPKCGHSNVRSTSDERNDHHDREPPEKGDEW